VRLFSFISYGTVPTASVLAVTCRFISPVIYYAARPACLLIDPIEWDEGKANRLEAVPSLFPRS
jgi:hypothetical protein